MRLECMNHDFVYETLLSVGRLVSKLVIMLRGTSQGAWARTKAIGDAASIYEQLLSMFPTSAKFWRLYMEAQLAANDDDAVKQIFSRCLLQCLHVDLWRAYLRYMRKGNDNRGPEGREEMKKAFEFMLGHIGFDINAGPVWLEYISFLKAAPKVGEGTPSPFLGYLWERRQMCSSGVALIHDPTVGI